MSNYKNNIPPERYNMLVEAMDACNYGMSNLPYEDAVKKLHKSIPVPDKNYTVLFGTHGLAATCWDIVSDTKVEEVRKFLASQKKVYKGMKFYVRIFVPIKYGKKAFLGTTAPNLVLWELDKVTDETASHLACQVSAIIGFPLMVVRKKAYKKDSSQRTVF